MGQGLLSYVCEQVENEHRCCKVNGAGERGKSEVNCGAPHSARPINYTEFVRAA